MLCLNTGSVFKKIEGLNTGFVFSILRGNLREPRSCDMEAAGLKLEPFQQLNGLWSTLGIQGSGEMQKQLLRELLDGFFFMNSSISHMVCCIV